MTRFNDLPLCGEYEVRKFRTGEVIFTHKLTDDGDYPFDLAGAIVSAVYAENDKIIVEVGI